MLRSPGFFAPGFLAIDIPWEDNSAATIMLRAALAIDEAFRIGVALLAADRI